MKKLLNQLANMQVLSIKLLRIAISIVMIWIGSLKYFNYESEGIVPYVANSPLMRFFYSHPDEYKIHELKEGQYNKENYIWHQQNNTYSFGLGLGILIVTIGIALLLNKYSVIIGMIAAVLVIVMSFTTLTFLVTTPESWVPNLGGSEHGFPLLAARGRLVVKDVIMMAGGFVALCDSARSYLAKQILEDEE